MEMKINGIKVFQREKCFYADFGTYGAVKLHENKRLSVLPENRKIELMALNVISSVRRPSWRTWSPSERRAVVFFAQIEQSLFDFNHDSKITGVWYTTYASGSNGFSFNQEWLKKWTSENACPSIKWVGTKPTLCALCGGYKVFRNPHSGNIEVYKTSEVQEFKSKEFFL